MRLVTIIFAKAPNHTFNKITKNLHKDIPRLTKR